MLEARHRYHELLLERHAASTSDAVAALSRENPIASPHLIERRIYDGALAATSRVNAALLVACDHLLRDEGARRALGLGSHFDGLIEIEREKGDHSMVARLDTFLDPHGAVHVIEYNSEPSGALQAHEVYATFAKLPIAAEFAQRYPFAAIDLDSLARSAIAADRARRGTKISTVAMLDGTVAPTDADTRWLPRVAERAGYKLIAAAAAELAYEHGRLMARDEPIDIVVFRDWYDVLATGEETLQPVFAALRDGAVRTTFGGSRGLVCQYKGVLELLSAPEHAQLFEAETNRALRAHVPWTRVLRDRNTTLPDGREGDLLPFVAANRDQLVIKPSGAASGAGVVLGWLASDAEWQRAIKKARGLQCVVQHRVDLAPPEPYYELGATGELVLRTYTADFDPYAWNGDKVAGAISRVSAGGRHNYACGAWLAPLWIIE